MISYDIMHCSHGLSHENESYSDQINLGLHTKLGAELCDSHKGVVIVGFNLQPVYTRGPVRFGIVPHPFTLR